MKKTVKIINGLVYCVMIVAQLYLMYLLYWVLEKLTEI